VDKIIIQGGNTLEGNVKISGAKNAALPLIAATLLAPGIYKLSNIPELRDIRTILALLVDFGISWERNQDSLIIDSNNAGGFEARYELVKTMRASVLVLGPLLARFGRARVSLPGGCAIGARPINFHLEALKRMGTEIELVEGYVDARVEGRLTGNSIYFDFPSVTGTENILMAAVLAKGRTVMKNVAKEPEIENLIDMLTAMGAKISGKNTDILIIDGVKELHPVDFRVIPDRIETGTYLIAAAAAGGEIKLTDCNPKHLPSLLEKMRLTGMYIKEGVDSITVARDGVIKNIDVNTMPYPGFPTDLQAQTMALMALSNGLSVITETIFENRFMHVAELRRMGADIKVDGHSAIVKGHGALSGAPVMATDLRASASLVVAGLAAKGETEISRVYHLDRGYEKIETKLSGLGAKIKRIKE
jgi:UDP-N-acetylglucosamine 1-carboxyvinyltransferase